MAGARMELRSWRSTLRGAFLCIAAVASVFCASAHAEPDRLGLALSGNGALAFYNTGVFKAMEEQGIRIDVIAGTGISSVFAALYATGHDAKAIQSAAERLAAALGSRSNAPTDYMSDIEVQKILIELFGPYDLSTSELDFDHLPVPLRITAQDARTGKQVVFRRGRLLPAIRASMSGYSMLEPYPIDGQRLIQYSGGNLDVVRAMGASVAICAAPMDLQGQDLRDADPDTKIRDLLNSQAAVMGEQGQRQLATLAKADLLFSPTIEGAGAADFRRVRELADAGFNAASTLMSQHSASLTWAKHIGRTAASTTVPTSWQLKAIAVAGNRFIPSSRVIVDFPLQAGRRITMEQLLNGVEALRSTGFYRSVGIEAAGGVTGVSLNVVVEEGSSRLPPEAMDNVLLALASDGANRSRAATALGTVALRASTPAAISPTVVADVQQALRSKSPDVRGRLAGSLRLSTTLGRRLLPSLVALVQSDPDPTVRQAAVAALARIAYAAIDDWTADERQTLAEGLESARTVADVEDPLATLSMSLQHMDAVAIKRAASSGERFVVDGGLPDDIAHAGTIQVNGSLIAIEPNPASSEIRFLGGGNDGQIHQGLNVVGAAKFWVEEQRLTRFSAPYQQSYAIVVAIDDYQRKRDPQHRGPTNFDALDDMVSGARKLADTLTTVGFPRRNIITLFDQQATSAAIEATLRDFWEGGKYASADRLLFFFGGHGEMTKEGQPLMVTYDYDSKRATATSFLMNDLADRQSRNLQPRQVLFALDACHAGLAIHLDDGSPQEQARLQKFQKLAVVRRDTDAKARNLLVAGTNEQRALYRGGGLFTKALIEGLEGKADLNHDGVVQFDELAFWIRNRVTTQAAAEGVIQDPNEQVLDRFGPGRMLFIHD